LLVAQPERPEQGPEKFESAYEVNNNNINCNWIVTYIFYNPCAFMACMWRSHVCISRFNNNFASNVLDWLIDNYLSKNTAAFLKQV